jgi:hypothetical protein
MGSYGIPGETGTHEQIDRELMTCWETNGVTREHTDCRLVGFRNHYSVYREDGKPVEIQLAVISRYRESQERDAEWVYKPMSETMGPCEVDCPLDLLDMVPCPDSEYAREWRANVRAYHARRASTRNLKAGDYFTTAMYEGQELQVLRFQGRTPVYLSPKDNRLYTMPRTRITSVRRNPCDDCRTLGHVCPRHRSVPTLP